MAVSGNGRRSDEPVTQPPDRGDKSWIFHIVPQSLAQPVDRSVQAVVEIHERVGGPQQPAKILARNYFIGTFQKDGENLEGTILKLDLGPFTAHLSGGKIGLKQTEANDPRGSQGLGQQSPARPGSVPQEVTFHGRKKNRITRARKSLTGNGFIRLPKKVPRMTAHPLTPSAVLHYIVARRRVPLRNSYLPAITLRRSCKLLRQEAARADLLLPRVEVKALVDTAGCPR